MDETKVIDLTPFGGEGFIEIGKPSWTAKVRMKNELGKRAKMVLVDGEPVVQYDEIGDVEIIKTLVYIRTAPFDLTLAGFLKFCDELDEKHIGTAEALFEEITKVVKEVAESPGPLGC